MDAIAAPRTGYLPINNRRRAVSIAAVVALYALALLVLLTIREATIPAPPRERPVVVTLLPLDKPLEDKAPRPSERPPQRARAQAPQPAVARPDEPPPPVASLNPLPAAAPPSPPAATGPITAGDGDAVYDLDTGGGGMPGAAPPRWVHKVTNDEFFPLVDPELLQASLEVDYRMQCTIALNTRVTCRVLREVPFYPGLRRAVLAAVPLLRMAPGKRDGRPIDGQRVEFLWRITVARGDVTLR